MLQFLESIQVNLRQGCRFGPFLDPNPEIWTFLPPLDLWTLFGPFLDLFDFWGILPHIFGPFWLHLDPFWLFRTPKFSCTFLHSIMHRLETLDHRRDSTLRSDDGWPPGQWLATLVRSMGVQYYIMICLLPPTSTSHTPVFLLPHHPTSSWHPTQRLTVMSLTVASHVVSCQEDD